MTTVEPKVVDWVISSGRRSAALAALAADELASAAKVSRRSGRTIQNSSVALRELEGAGLAAAVGEGRKSWKSYRLTDAGRLVAQKLGGTLEGGQRRSHLRLLPHVEGGTVRDLFQILVSRPVVAGPDEPIEAIMARIIADPGSRAVYVVDGEGHLQGTIPLRRLLALGEAALKGRRPGARRRPRTASDFARPSMAVHPSDPVEVALRRIRESGLDDLPVVNSQGALLGELNGQEVLIYLASVAVERAPSEGPQIPGPRAPRAARG
jgi:CBS domain-containing protein